MVQQFLRGREKEAYAEEGGRERQRGGEIEAEGDRGESQ